MRGMRSGIATRRQLLTAGGVALASGVLSTAASPPPRCGSTTCSTPVSTRSANPSLRRTSPTSTTWRSFTALRFHLRAPRAHHLRQFIGLGPRRGEGLESHEASRRTNALEVREFPGDPDPTIEHDVDAWLVV